jgi:hypothetical protein
MSFHDSLAEGALRDGNTPAEFRAAAQRHANAFWFYMIIAAVTWFFFGWGWSLLPFGLALFVALQSVSSTLVAGKMEQLLKIPSLPPAFDLSDPVDVLTIDDIRERYSALLADESGPYSQCMYRPAALLPYPKEEVRLALTALLDFAEGRQNSDLLDRSMRHSDVARVIRTALQCLDDYLDVAPERLPADPVENARIGRQLQIGGG